MQAFRADKPHVTKKEKAYKVMSESANHLFLDLLTIIDFDDPNNNIICERDRQRIRSWQRDLRKLEG